MEKDNQEKDVCMKSKESNWPDELLDEMLDRYDAARKRNWDAFWDKHFPTRRPGVGTEIHEEL